MTSAAVCKSFPPVEGRRARVLILGSMPGKASLDAFRYYAHPRNAFWTILCRACEQREGTQPASPHDLQLESRLDRPHDPPHDPTLETPHDPPDDPPLETQLGTPHDSPLDTLLGTPHDPPLDTPLEPPLDPPLDPRLENVQFGALRLPTELPDYATRIETLRRHGIALWDVLALCERDGSLDSSIRRASERGNDIAAFCRRHPELSSIVFNGRTAATLFQRHSAVAVHAVQPALRFTTLPSTSPAHASMPLAEKQARWQTALTIALATP